jgi:hypothetical protein
MKTLKDYILEKNWDKYQQNTYPNDEIKDAVYDYVSGMTSGVNDDLRKGIKTGSKKVIERLDKAFTEKRKLDVYRTVDWDYMKNIYGVTKENINDFLGETFENKGYMSTSKIFKSPWGNQWSTDELVLHITSTAPYPCIDVNKMFDASEIDCADQEEIILPRNTKLILKDVSQMENKHKTYLLEMEII